MGVDRRPNIFPFGSEEIFAAGAMKGEDELRIEPFRRGMGIMDNTSNVCSLRYLRPYFP